jgi:hypothetical protein
MDIYFRAKVLKSILHRKYGIANIVSEGGKIVSIIVDFGKDTIRFKSGEIWIIEEGHIFNKAKKEKGFFASADNIMFEDGLPTIYIDRSSIKPLHFYAHEDKVRPDQIGAILLAWVENWKAKVMKGLKTNNLIQYVIILVIFLCLAMSYMAYQSANDAKGIVMGIRDTLSGATVQPVNPVLTYTPTPVRGG